MTARRWTLTLSALAALLLAACGSGSGGKAEDPIAQVPKAGGLQQRVADAQHAKPSDFEAVKGRTLEQLAQAYGARPNSIALASSVFTKGMNRIAFGTVDDQTRFVYGRSAVYVAPKMGAKAAGPYVAPADVLVTKPAFRSKQAATETDPFAAIYAADDVKLQKPGTYSVLTITRTPQGAVASTGAIRVLAHAQDPVPEVGDRAPKVATDTLADAGGVASRIDTRDPPSDMHKDSFADVVGKKPVALLFATPQLCQSRVCGPVVDIALQLRQRYGDRIDFIHQEVYVDNNPQKGIRPPLQAFHLPSEPWLFVVGKDGRITARLEGSFGIDEFEAALKTAL